ncbi:MAG: DUF1934 domain-containing protein [Lachnospiraceae bacterium]|nr:DUF1934 domain-containing protein [Lachnospiraceae bacterium]
MTKQVLITISGLQLMGGETGRPVEVVTAGEYYQKNGKHYLFYEEAVEGSREHIENRLKIGEGSLEVTKKGLIRTHMVFEKGRKTKTSYETPFGGIEMEFATSKVLLQESEESMDLQVCYSMEMDNVFLADCSIRVNVKSKNAKDFRLQET